MYCTDPCFTGFRGARRDANTGGPDVQQPPADQDIDKGGPCLDAAAEDGRRGSNVCEVNPWLWQFGRGKPRLGGLTIHLGTWTQRISWIRRISPDKSG